MTTALVLSCEHGGNAVPPELAERFADAAGALASHRGWDPGALELALDLAADTGAPLLACTVSRLVVDANRSRDRPGLLSEWTRVLPPAEREALLERFWAPHRAAVEASAVAALAAGEQVLHVSVHSFTPVWEGRERAVDVGLLFDLDRPAESRFARRWMETLAAERSWRVAANEPYLGTDDGLTTELRGRLGERYLGIEVEVSQRYPLGTPAEWSAVRAAVVASLRRARAG